jgi:membrane-bound ClpP family serine protease
MCVGAASVGPADVAMRDVATIQGVVCLIANGLSVIMSLLVLLGFVMIVYGAIIYMISGGQPQLLQKGVDTIRMVIIGIILALSSFIIINIIAEFTGVSSLLSVNFIWQPRTP